MVRSLQWSFVGTGKGFDRIIGEIEVMDTLFAVEKAHPRAGVAMLETFFPGRLLPSEKARWDELNERADTLSKSLEQRNNAAG